MNVSVLNRKHLANKKHNLAEMTEESDTETSPAEANKTVRVKFAKPETERQKKRREASALHR